MDVSVGIILGIIGLVLQRMVMPEVERWVTNSGCTGTPFISSKTSNPYTYISSQLLRLTLVCLLFVTTSVAR